MHELSIAISLLEVAEEEAQRQGGGKVLAIHLRLGALSGVVKEALGSAFELAREQSIFSDCRLVCIDVPIIIHCAVCESDQPVKSMQEICCAVCGTPSMQVVSGRELEIVAMEIADEHANATG